MRFIVAITFFLLSLSPVALAQDKLLTIDDIYDPIKKVNFSGSPPLELQWLKSGTHYLQSKQASDNGAAQLMKVDARTGEATPFYDAAKMEAALAKVSGVSAAEAKRLAYRGSNKMNEAETAVLLNHNRDLLYYELGGDNATRLTNNPEEETNEEFSPDGRTVAFVRANNLYVVDVATGRETALTKDGAEKILNGRLDWVYEEELYGRGNTKGFWWSPDSQRLAFLRFDETPVREFVVVDHTSRLQNLEATPYPKAGDPNPLVRLGVANVSGSAPQWIETGNYESTDFLISRVAWTPEGKRVVFQAQDREQTWLDVNFAGVEDGKVKTAWQEKARAWVEVIDNPHWLKDGSFLWLSDRSGFRHLYHYSSEGNLKRTVTEGTWDVRSLEGVDEVGNVVYFTGTQHSPIAPHLYRIKLDGSGATRLTQQEGTHRISLSPTATHYIDYWSAVGTPTQVRLYGANGTLTRMIDENRVGALGQYRLGTPEFLQVKTRDGFVLEAMMIKPPDFDPRKKYPVWSHTYSGPQAPTVRNSWGGATYMWHQMLAQKGYIIWICDNRTASNKGVQSAWPLYRNLGELELRDLEDGLTYLKGQPYVDASRIGLWGWSYGGYMTSYALTHSTSFKIGIAGGSVTDFRLYDSIYTERYMSTPQKNPEGYKRGAPLAAARNLHGKLLLLHGTIDDNVHVQNTIQFAYELQKAGKQFELMLYPKQRHGITDPSQLKHMRQLMTDFVMTNL